MDSGPTALNHELQALLQSLAAALRSPAALVSRDDQAWRFEGEALPPGFTSAGEPPFAALMQGEGDVIGAEGDAAARLTGIVIGKARGREWVLLLPGGDDVWRGPDTLEAAVEGARRSLKRLLDARDEREVTLFGRRIYAFARRLFREANSARVHALILRTIAAQVRARTGVLAVYCEADDALAIRATHGYPLVIVEHLRIAPGEGILGGAYAEGRADLRHVPSSQRLRYRTSSYLVIPIAGAGRPSGVIALTDRADGRPFDATDLAQARILSAHAALALSRERMQRSLSEFQRVAAIDSVTGLFNRRHFEARLHAEVQRAQRHQQPLALLMVDVDDFKRVNDTFGHLEGDRTLKIVADLLRGGVRIFDVSARYGGEEFAILMPGALLETAAQVAERIRRRVHHRFRHDAVGVTISIGVATLAPGETGEDLVGEADRRLGLAKRAGKNAVEAYR